MVRVIVTLIVSVALGHLAAAQACARIAGSPMDMQVQLTMDSVPDAVATDDTIGVATASNDAKHGSSGNTREQSHQFSSAMNIRVELQDSLGTRVGDGVPNGEGRLSFLVCSRITYRLRVTGADIEEVNAENLEPGRGDKMVSLTLHHKGDKSTHNKAGSAVSASRLKIPRNAQKALENGNKSLASGNLAEAQQYFEKAIKAYKDYDQAYNNLGVTLMQKGDRAAGKAAFEKAVSINGHFARALTNLARIALADKEYRKGLELVQKSLASEPLNPRALLVGTESAYFSGDYSATVLFARTLHTLQHQGMGVAHYLSAKSLEKEGHDSDAISEYQRFLMEDPNDPNAKRAQMAIIELQSSAHNSVNN
jgi:hypothetical protein